MSAEQRKLAEAVLSKLAEPVTIENVNHPAHYGGADNLYEVIKVLYAWKLDTNFCLGNIIKYIARHEHKKSALEDLKKARWYLDEHIKHMEHSK